MTYQFKLDQKWEDMGFRCFAEGNKILLMNGGAVLKTWPDNISLSEVDREIHQALCETEFETFIKVVKC